MPPDPQPNDEADRKAALGLVSVPRETAARLTHYVALLRQWQNVKNLVAPSTLDRIWTRHIADSAQLASLMPEASQWVDLGSGAGFPGMVVALMVRTRPGATVHLVESNARKCAFLRDVARTTAAPVRIHAGRIEDVLPSLGSNIEVVTSRALAPLPRLIEMSRSLLDSGAVGLFLTGEDAADSATLDQLSSDYLIDAVPSLTQVGARILKVRARTNRETTG